MRHPLYEAAKARFVNNDPFRAAAAHDLEAQDPSWWQWAIHPQTMLDYLNARDDANRVSAMVTMMEDAFRRAVAGFRALESVAKKF